MDRTKSQDLIYGRNPVLETLRANRRPYHSLILQAGLDPNPLIDQILELAAQRQIPISEGPRSDLDRHTRHHQGVMLQVGPYPYVDLPDILALAESRSEPALLLILDQLQDPQNMGTLLRTAEAVGVHGVLVPAHHAVGVTPAVASASSGASEHLFIARDNLAQAMRALKDQEIWLVGLEHGERAQPIEHANLRGPIGLVVGSEGSGLRPLVRSSCDNLVSIPMRGRLESLNAAVAGSLALYRIWEQREYQR